MAEPDRALGSGRRRPVGAFETGAGRNVHVAGRPQLIPVPSLLRSLMSDHLDPGYAAAASQRAGAPETARARVRVRVWAWEALAALLVAAVFAVAVTQARSVAPGVIAEQQALAGSVRSAESATGTLADRRVALATQVNELQRRQLADGTQGRQLLAGLDVLSLAAADSPVIGPGLTVTVTEPGVSRNLSDVSKQRVAGSQQIILDRDLQVAVNWLWASGAEAIAVDGVRIGPNVTLRQAGGSILVDNSPISSPYTILAVGPPHSMRDAFDHSPGLFRLRLLENGYGVGVSVSAGDGLALPAGAVRDVKFAKRIGP